MLSLSVLSGCTTGRYLTQAGCGQIDLLMRARSIEGATRDPHVDPRTRRLLGMVADIKKYGERRSLKPTANYRTYVELPRNAVVYVVTASEPLRFHSKTWWFPIVGTVPYLGWFDRDDAKQFSAELADEGWDSDVGTASAYSTLGWFNDPVLSTMIAGDEEEAAGELVNVVLHESTHATLYIDGQTRFNESLAEFAADKLAIDYMDEKWGPASKEKKLYLEAEKRADERHRRMHRAYEELEKLYASKLPVAEKLAEKKRILVELRYETHYRRPINNATLSAFKNYNSATPELSALLAACDGSFARFFATLTALKKKGSFPRPNTQDIGPVLRPLVDGKCPAPPT